MVQEKNNEGLLPSGGREHFSDFQEAGTRQEVDNIENLFQIHTRLKMTPFSKSPSCKMKNDFNFIMIFNERFNGVRSRADRVINDDALLVNEE